MKTFTKTFLIVSFALILPDFSYAQNTNSEEQADPKPTLEEVVSYNMPDQTDVRFINISAENDLFASGKDQYYTNGFRASYFDAGLDLPNWAKKLGELYPGFKLNETTSLSLSFGQNLYTPRDITIAAEQPNDRPWAAWLYGSAGMVSITENHVEELEVTIGMVGPAALGRQTQKFVHKYTDSPEPMGWDHQLDNELGVNFSWGRRWPDTWGTPLTDSLYISAMPSVEISLGNVYTHAQSGILFRISPTTERLSDLPLRVRPSLPGTGYYQKPAGGFSWSLFGGVNGRLVGRNIFLDGNTFEDSPSVDKKNFVYDASLGADMTYGQTRVSYTVVRRSKEFDTQDKASVFGAISVSRRF